MAFGLEFHSRSPWEVAQDLNGDGTVDAAIYLLDNYFNRFTLVLLGLDREWTTNLVDGAPSFAESIPTAVGDVDGDGVLELVRGVGSNADAVVVVSRGDSETPASPLVPTGDVYVFEKSPDRYGLENDFVHLADMTGDSTLDLIYAQSSVNEIVILPGVSQLSAGDVDRDGETNLIDLNLLSHWTHPSQDANESPLRLDMTGDHQINKHDVDHWVTVIAKTHTGDLDLNGKVEFADFLKLSKNYGLTDATYSQGDLDGDGSIGFADFLVLSANFGFSREP